MVQVHFQFLTQALQKVQPVAHSCFAEVVVPEKKNSSGGGSLSGMGHTPELEEAVRSWRGAAEVTDFGKITLCSNRRRSRGPLTIVPQKNHLFRIVGFEVLTPSFNEYLGKCLLCARHVSGPQGACLCSESLGRTGLQMPHVKEL